MIHRWSIEHPWVVIAFYAAVVAVGILSVSRIIPRRFMPYIESPMIGVISMMPGLSAEEMETYISKPIEEQLVHVKGLRYIRSSSQDGLSVVSLEFGYGTDMQRSLFDVQSLMNVIQSNLPPTSANLKPSWVLPIDPLNIPVLTLALTGDDRWDMASLRQLADTEIVNRLKSVPNVYSIVPFGGYRRQLQVIVDRDRLAARNLSMMDVRRSLDAFNANRSGGRITGGPSESSVRFESAAATPADVLEYPIVSQSAGAAGGSSGGGMNSMSSGDTGEPPGAVAPSSDSSGQPPIVRIRDVATVTDAFWERRSAYHYYSGGKPSPAISVSVIQDPEASSYAVVPEVLKTIRQIERENPGVKFDIAYDNAEFVGILFHNMIEELAMAVVLTGVALVLFLGQLRAALIALITLPISLLMAITGIGAIGMSLNSGTLIGLLLSIGRLVDDSVIDIHAVERHMRLGKPPKEATIDGIAEVRLAVIASTLMLVLALVPLLFAGGIVEMMFRELVWPIIFGLLASMIVSFTLTALLTANLLKPEHEMVRERSTWFYRKILGPFQQWLDRLETGYENTIRWMLRHRFANMTRIAITVIIGFTFYNFIGSEMMPLADVGQAYGILEMEPGTSFEQTEKAAIRAQEILGGSPEITRVSTEVGTETMFESFSPFFTGYAMPQANAATMMITLTDKDTRSRTIWEVIDTARLEALQTIPGIRRFQIKEMGSDVMASSLAPISLLVSGPDLATLDALGREVAAVAEQTPGAFQVGTSWTMSKPTWTLHVRPDAAAAAGVSPDDIAGQAYYALGGGLTNEFFRLPGERQSTVQLRLREDQRTSPSDLGNLYIKTPAGQVPLESLADVALEHTPSVIEHDGLKRTLQVLAYYRPGHPPSMDVSMDIMMRAFEQVDFPAGYSLEVRGDMTQMMDSFRRLLYGLLVAMVFIFLVLIAQFRGVLQPLQMVFSLPLELSGVFLALWLAHQAFSTVSIMGVIVLTGMDITTAILLIDIIMRYRDSGLTRDEAVIRACPQRLRPILMTSLITMIVMLPVALFPKTGMDAYQPLGTVIVGGLLIGTILSLFDIPIMHTYVDDLTAWAYRRFLKKEWKWPVNSQQ